MSIKGRPNRWRPKYETQNCCHQKIPHVLLLLVYFVSSEVPKCPLPSVVFLRRLCYILFCMSFIPGEIVVSGKAQSGCRYYIHLSFVHNLRSFTSSPLVSSSGHKLAASSLGLCSRRRSEIRQNCLCPKEKAKVKVCGSRGAVWLLLHV